MKLLRAIQNAVIGVLAGVAFAALFVVYVAVLILLWVVTRFFPFDYFERRQKSRFEAKFKEAK